MTLYARIIESILFIEKDPLSVDTISQMTNISIDDVEKALKEINKHYLSSDHGVFINETKDNKFHFTPCVDLHDELRKTYGKKVDKRLSKAALETLSIVAYSQPITRSQIDKIRGVVSDSIVRLLREREYIKIVGRENNQGHACLYGTSRKFLFEFGLKSISDLPKLSQTDSQRFDKEEGDLF